MYKDDLQAAHERIKALENEANKTKEKPVKKNKRQIGKSLKRFLFGTSFGIFLTVIVLLMFYCFAGGLSYRYITKNCDCLDSKSGSTCCDEVASAIGAIVWPVAIPSVFAYRLTTPKQTEKNCK